MEKLSALKLYSFVVGVGDTGDYPLHSNIIVNFHKNLK
jgi:hypothetical protein